jgi:hypothetical protein
VEAGPATEGEAALAKDGHTHESACLNCGTRLIGEHCHSCGQRAHVHRTIGAFFHDLLHGVLHFEGKTWRTLPMLAWRPGELTRRYIDGERARFVSPLGLFLFTVFLMFVVFSSLGGPLPPDTMSQVQTGMTESAKAIRGQVVELERRRDAMAAAGQPVGEVEAQLEQQRKEADLMDQVQREGLLRGFGHRIVDDLPEGFWKKAVEKFNKDPALTIYKLQNNAYKFSWLLVPIMVPFVWLLFLWRRRHWQLYDHTVFVTYQLSFQSLSLVLFATLGRAGVPFRLLMLAFFIIASVNVHRQFRGAYQLSWFSAFWRMVAFTFVLGTAVAIFLVALVALGAVG